MSAAIPQHRALRSSAPLIAILCALAAACRPSALPPRSLPCPPAPAAAKPAPPAAPAVTPRYIPNIAVLPIEDEQLFRNERSALRAQLYTELKRRMPDHTFTTLSELDSKLLPVSPKGGERCAYPYVDARARAQDQGWATTDLTHILGTEGKLEQLWVDVDQRGSNIAAFAATFDPKLDRMTRYLTSFSQLLPNPNAGVLGGLSVADVTFGARANGVTLCEAERYGGCKKSSASWQDVVGKLASCFAGVDEASERVLVHQQGAAARCEITNLDDLGGTRGARETCLCAALTSSAAMAESSARRVLRVHQLATDLPGRARPQLRLIEASTQLYDVEQQWHQPRDASRKRSLPPLRRLSLPNLDALAAPLSRCDAPEGTSALAALTLSETGVVSAATLLTPNAPAPLRSCIERELKRGAFACTGSGKSAQLRVLIEWPIWPAAKP